MGYPSSDNLTISLTSSKSCLVLFLLSANLSQQLRITPSNVTLFNQSLLVNTMSKNWLLFPQLFIYSTFLVLISATNNSARPNPDNSGICYYFVGNNLESVSPCVIHTGYGTGIHYETQDWSNGNRVEVYLDYSSVDSEEPEITVNDKLATQSYRDTSFYNRVKDPTQSIEDTMGCYDIVETNESICSKY